MFWSVDEITGFLDSFKIVNKSYHGNILPEKERKNLAGYRKGSKKMRNGDQRVEVDKIVTNKNNIIKGHVLRIEIGTIRLAILLLMLLASASTMAWSLFGGTCCREQGTYFCWQFRQSCKHKPCNP
jgi:hypothetical protein